MVLQLFVVCWSSLHQDSVLWLAALFQCDCHTCVVTNTVIEADKVAACLSGWTRCQHDVNTMSTSAKSKENSHLLKLFFICLSIVVCFLPAGSSRCSRLLTGLVFIYLVCLTSLLLTNKQTKLWKGVMKWVFPPPWTSFPQIRFCSSGCINLHINEEKEHFFC